MSLATGRPTTEAFVNPFFFFLFLLSLVTVLIPAAQAKKPCYRQDGTKFGTAREEYMHPCRPWGQEAHSHCCSPSDYCTDNGLCLDAGGADNLFTLQGCTDASWKEGGCIGGFREFMAPSDSKKGMGYVFLGRCDEGRTYCPGAPACCRDDKVPKVHVKPFTHVYRPGHPPRQASEHN